MLRLGPSRWRTRATIRALLCRGAPLLCVTRGSARRERGVQFSVMTRQPRRLTGVVRFPERPVLMPLGLGSGCGDPCLRRADVVAWSAKAGGGKRRPATTCNGGLSSAWPSAIGGRSNQRQSEGSKVISPADQTSFKWSIDGFSSLLEKKDSWKNSRVFEIRGLYWYLKLNPRDRKSGDEKEYVSLWLELVPTSVKPRTIVEASIKFLIYDQSYGKHNEHEVSHSFQMASTISGTSCLIPLMILRPCLAQLLQQIISKRILEDSAQAVINSRILQQIISKRILRMNCIIWRIRICFLQDSPGSGLCRSTIRAKQGLKELSSGFLLNNSCVFGVKFFKVVTSKTNSTSERLFVQKMNTINEGKAYTWDIEDFFTLKNPDYSSEFESSGYQWSIKIYPIHDGNYLSLYLNMKTPNSISKHPGNLVELTLSIKDQENGKHREKTGWCQFSNNADVWGWNKFMTLEDFKDLSNGYLVKTKCCIEAEFVIIGSSKMD